MSKNLEIKANALKGNALRQYKQTITLNAIQKEVIVGTPPQVRDIRCGGARDQKLIWVHHTH